MSLFSLSLFAQEENKALKEFANQTISYKFEKVENDSLAKVFKGDIYQSSVWMWTNYSSELSKSRNRVHKMVLIQDGDLVNELDVEGSLESDVMFKFIQPKYKLKTEKDAKYFHAALNAIYPPFGGNYSGLSFMEKDGNWYFVRGESFGKKKGYLVETDENGKIKVIKFKRKIEL